MKKNGLIAFGVILFVVVMVILACMPKFLKEYELKSNAIIKNNCKIATNKIIEIKNIDDLEKRSIEIVDKLNESNTNPITKKELAFSVNKKCIGCVNIEFDKNTKSINATGYDKDLKILCRTIVKPPSFVTYEREEKWVI